MEFDVGVWDAGLEVEDGVGVETEGVEDSLDFGVLVVDIRGIRVRQVGGGRGGD